MAKFYGQIGFAVTTETSPGIWKETIVERPYYGDVVRNSRRLTSSETINGDIDINNEISIVSDPYANENFHSMRYVRFMGALWKITSATVAYPRITLNLGGVYNA